MNKNTHMEIITFHKNHLRITSTTDDEVIHEYPLLSRVINSFQFFDDVQLVGSYPRHRFQTVLLENSTEYQLRHRLP